MPYHQLFYLFHALSPAFNIATLVEQEILTIPEDRVCFVVVVVVFTTCHIDKYGKHFEYSMILHVLKSIFKYFCNFY
jgi:hypothetical protein